mgnify:CR=1 FL=1
MGYEESNRGRPVWEGSSAVTGPLAEQQAALDFEDEATVVMEDCIPFTCRNEVHARIAAALRAAYERGKKEKP